jgi:hypothetical protein
MSGSVFRQAQAVPADDLDQFAQAVLVEGALAALALVVILEIEDALEVRIEPGHLAHGVGNELAEPAVGRMIAQRLPSEVARKVKTDNRLAAVLQGVGMVASIEDERQNEVLELGRIGSAANGAGGVPEPGLQSADVQPLVGGGMERQDRLLWVGFRLPAWLALAFRRHGSNLS